MNREQIRDVIVENIGPAVSYTDAGRVADELLPLHSSALAQAWEQGALWAAVECGAIDSEQSQWLAPGENPYEGETSREKSSDGVSPCGS